MQRLNSLAKNYTLQMHRFNSDNALQSVVELMLTDRPTNEVISALIYWAEYLEERK